MSGRKKVAPAKQKVNREAEIRRIANREGMMWELAMKAAAKGEQDKVNYFQSEAIRFARNREDLESLSSTFVEVDSEYGRR